VDRNLRFVLLREIPEGDANLRQQWDALVARMDRPQVFYTWEWALAVQRAYHSTLRPLIFLAYDEDESLSGLAAIALDAEGKQASFLCATTGDYCDFISSTNDRFALVSGVLAELCKQGINDITLTNLPGDSASVAALQRASKQNHCHCFMRTAYECAQVSFERLERGKDGEPLAPGKKRIRRLAKAVAAEGSVQFVHSRAWDGVAPILPGFVRAHVVRFLETGRISNLASAHRRVFLTELSQLLSTPGWLVVSRMNVGDRTVAWHYGFQFHDTWFWYQPTFDSSLQKHWPGFCLLTQVIQDATEIPELTNIDLGLGSEAYKAKFANASRGTLYVTLHRSLVMHWMEIARYWVAKAVRKHPSTEKLADALRTGFSSFRARLRTQGVKQTMAWAGKRVLGSVWARDEVYFYEMTNAKPALQSDGIFLKAIDFDTLATAALQNPEDEGTLAYLLRCANRLRKDDKDKHKEDDSRGFALSNQAGELLHFTWAGRFENFFWSELNSGLPSPAPGAVILFDSWTPISQRGRGYYGPTLGLVVAKIREEGKRSWGFSASTNTSSVKGLEKAGFRRNFSVFRYRFLWWQKIIQKNAL